MWVGEDGKLGRLEHLTALDQKQPHPCDFGYGYGYRYGSKYEYDCDYLTAMEPNNGMES